MNARPKPTPVRVPIDHLDSVAIRNQATVRHESFDTTVAAYRRSTLQMQDVGLLGEHADAHWLRAQDLDVVEIADDEGSRRRGFGDIGVRRPQINEAGRFYGADLLTFEVKTSRISSWRRYERTLDATQLARSNVDGYVWYVWCVVADTLPTESVVIMGWLPTNVARAPESGHDTVEHDRPHWRVTTPLQDMRDIPEVWQTLKRVPF